MKMREVRMLALIHHHGPWLAAISIALTLMGIVAVLIVSLRLPADYFIHKPKPATTKKSWKVLRWIIGIALFILGLLMSLPLIPGPGIIIMLLALSIVDFPGKRRFETWLLRIPGILKGINALRRYFHKPMLKLPSRANAA